MVQSHSIYIYYVTHVLGDKSMKWTYLTKSFKIAGMTHKRTLAFQAYVTK